MWIVIGIIAVIALAVVGVAVTARSRTTTGRLSRETRKRDEAAGASAPAVAVPEDETTVAEASDEARARADEARRAIESGGTTVPATRPESAAVVYEPVDLEELGVTRRQFFNRAILAGPGLGLGPVAVAPPAFPWPTPGAVFR